MAFGAKVSGLSAAVKAEIDGSAPALPLRELSDETELADRVYVIGLRGTNEFLESWQATGYDTVKWKETWTEDRKKVKRFTMAELSSRSSDLLMLLTCSYGASIWLKRVK